jgi:hypothetical protein
MKLLNTAETSDRLRTPVETLRYWRHTGQGPKSFRIGRRVMYAEQDVITWLEEQRGRAAS